MNKEAMLGTGLVTAFKAAKTAFKTGKKKGVGSRIGSTVDKGVASLAKTHGYKGNLGGMLKRTAGGEVRGLSNFGKVVGGMGVAGATGYAAG